MKHSQWFPAQFAPPRFEGDETKTRQARVLVTLLCSFLPGFIINLVFIVPFVYQEKLISGAGIASLFLVHLFALWLTRRGNVFLASHIVLLSLWLSSTLFSWVSGGVRSPEIILFAAVTALGGLLLGARGSLFFGGISVLTLLGMAGLEMSGYIFPTLFTLHPFVVWLVAFATLGAIVIPINITTGSLNATVQRAQLELDERRQAEENARRRTEEVSLLYRFGLAIAQGNNLYETILNIRAQLSELIPNHLFFVALYDSRTDEISYPVFYVGGRNLRIPIRKMSQSPGITGAVIRHQATLYVPDINDPAADSSYNPLRRMDVETRTFLGVPLLVGKEITGVISLQHNDPEAYSQEQVSLVETLAIQISNAIEKVRLIDQLQSELSERRRVEEEVRHERDLAAEHRRLLQKVLEVGKRISEVSGLDACLHTTHAAIQQELGLDRVSIFLHDPQSDSLQLPTCHLHNPANPHTFSAPPEAAAWQETLQTPGKALITLGEKNAPLILVLVSDGEKPVALLAADNALSGRQIRPEAVEALRLLAGYVGLNIRNTRLHEELEQRVQERTAQLQLTMTELESFSYSVGHDLRAPLRGIQGYSQMTLEEDRSLRPHTQNNLRNIIHAARTMGELIDALLNFSRITRAPLQMSSTDLTALAQEITDHLVLQDPERQAQITIQPGIFAECDPHLLHIALQNLLENAWKFTSKNPHTQIEFGYQPETNTYYIRDNGAGFSMAYSHKLFGAFQRLHRADEFSGHGTGLAITQRIIQRHGGRIWAQAEPNQGATFFFTLP